MSSVDEVTAKLAETSVGAKYELSFKGKELKLNKAADAQEIIKGIEECKLMTALRLEGNTLGVEAAEAIAKALGKHPEFERALWSDMFTGRLKTEIPHALKHLGAAIMGAKCRLVELDLSHNAFGPNGVVGLMDLLKSESCYSLQELKLNNNGLGIGGGKMLAECLSQCHKSSVAAGQPLALKVFISGRNRLENDGATALAAAFKAIGTLETLAMPQNGINHPGISALADAISANPRLRHLDLNDNTFTAKGAEAIAKALPKLSNLEVINFGDCLVRTEGAKCIAGVLKNSHKQLKELILSGNEITKAGALEVAQSLEGKTSLEKIDLNANCLGEEGCSEVQSVLDAVGSLDALASFSDDEGSEEEEDDGEDYGDEEDPEEDEEGDVSTDPHLQVQGSALTPNRPPISARDFLTFPSPTKLLQLGQNGGQALVEELGEDKHDIDKVVETVFKVSLVVNKEDEAKAKACECADQILQPVFKTNDNATNLVVNTILVYLGLIKGEDKKRKPPTNIVGPLLVLEHVVRQPYLTQAARQMLRAFITKPHPLLEKSSDAHHKILQTLYSF